MLELALACRGQRQSEPARIRGARPCLEQTGPLQGFQGAQQRGAVHAEYRRELGHRRLALLLEENEDGKLRAGEPGIGQVTLVEPGDAPRSLTGREAVAGAETRAFRHVRQYICAYALNQTVPCLPWRAPGPPGAPCRGQCLAGAAFSSRSQKRSMAVNRSVRAVGPDMP